ncbi:hypothetical protein Agabi119p4_8228 [Agaricus bisporus var. burnettii]|uniref:DUF6699 domain-containing protein n=1 Tax=Agaricus bisporus var. burnettii TaxID=192524 RepID=A0A8H7C669_AGABI|nr:hypothetical protein Agabi119p4_8228 [Agaricus bisporus var. burnettii]
MATNPRASPPRRPSSCTYAPQMAASPSTSRAGTPPRVPIAQPHPYYIPQTTEPHQYIYRPASSPPQPNSQTSTSRIPQSTNLDNNPPSPPRQQHVRWSSSPPPLQMPEPNPTPSNNLPATHQQNEQRPTTRTSRRTSRVDGSPRVSQSRQRNSELRSISPFVYHYQNQSSASVPAVSTNCLHPVLMYSTLPRLDCDFRFSLSDPGQFVESISKEVLHEPAVTPPVTELQLALPNLTRWPIKVVPTQSTGRGVYYVSIGDVFNAIYSCLRVRLSPEDYKAYAKCYPYPHIIKKKAHVAFYVRCRESSLYQQELNNGLRRVDLLMGRTRFRGLAQSETSSKEWVVLCD